MTRDEKVMAWISWSSYTNPWKLSKASPKKQNHLFWNLKNDSEPNLQAFGFKIF